MFIQTCIQTCIYTYKYTYIRTYINDTQRCEHLQVSKDYRRVGTPSRISCEVSHDLNNGVSSHGSPSHDEGRGSRGAGSLSKRAGGSGACVGSGVMVNEMTNDERCDDTSTGLPSHRPHLISRLVYQQSHLVHQEPLFAHHVLHCRGLIHGGVWSRGPGGGGRGDGGRGRGEALSQSISSSQFHREGVGGAENIAILSQMQVDE